MVKVLSQRNQYNQEPVYKELTTSGEIYISETDTSITLQTLPTMAGSGLIQSGNVISVSMIDPFLIRGNNSANVNVLTSINGTASWLPVEDAISSLLENPTIRDRIENVINAHKNLDMTIKLTKE